MAILRDAGFDAESPDDLVAWARDEQQKVVFLTVLVTEDWALLETLGQLEVGALVVALLPDTKVDTYVRAFRAGASGAIPRDASPNVFRESLAAALNGRCSVPLEVLRILLGSEPTPALPDAPSHAELEWLRHLANGMTINELAARVGYSERMMFRLLSSLYTKMGVKNRMEAILRSRDKGWID